MNNPSRSFLGQIADKVGLGQEWDNVTTEIGEGAAELRTDLKGVSKMIKVAAADTIIAVDKKTGLDNVTDANVATIWGAKAGALRGAFLGPVGAVKGAALGAISARLLMTSNVKDVRAWANSNCTKPPSNEGGMA